MKWVPIAILVGFAPLMLWHLAQLSQKSHYQFLVFLPICAYLLVKSKLPEEGNEGGEANYSQPIYALIILVICVLGLGLATFMWSPWLATVFALIAGLPAIWALGGWGFLHRWLPLWILSWAIIPPPFGLDEDLILWLRRVATQMTSAVLDQFGILHLSYGNVIELPEKKLFVADACSGIHSLYVLMAAALFLALWNRRNLIHGTLLIVTTFGIVLLENVGRLTAVAVGLKNQIDLSEGTSHSLLGFVLFAVSLGLLLSGDQLLRFALGPEPRIPFAKTKEDQSAKRSQGKPARLSSGWATSLMCVAFVFPILGAAQLVTRPKDLPPVALTFDDSIKLPEFDLSTAPEAINALERKEFKTIQRVPGDPFGRESQQWTFQHDSGIEVLVSVDFPYYDGVHDACLCYSQIGWVFDDQFIQRYEDMSPLGLVGPGTNAPVGTAKMHKELEGHGLLYSSCSDLNGGIGVILKELVKRNVSERFSERLGRDGIESDGSAGTYGEPPFVQYQLLAKSADEFTEQEETALLQLYLDMREILRLRIVESFGNESE